MLIIYPAELAKIYKPLNFTCLMAEVNILHTTKELCLNKQLIKMPDLNEAHTIYQFICSCGDTFKGRKDVSTTGGTSVPVLSEADDSPLAQT